ncbi:MAG: sugar ABC transporter substrate-binding protein [Desulfitobacteriaceae bacterium]
MFKKFLSVGIIAVLALSLAGCGTQSADNSAKTNGDKKVTIGFANLTDEITFGQAVKKGMIAEAQKRGWDIIAVDNKLDGATAVTNADTLLTRGINFFVEFNVDASVGPAIMEKMNAAKVPVIAIDIPHPGATFFGANNPEAGRQVGMWLGNFAKNNWNGQVDALVLVENPTAGEVPQQRMDGIVKGVKEIFPDFDEKKIVRVDGRNDEINAKRTVTDMLTAHPNARHILIGTLNDQNGSGALAALETTGRQNDAVIVSQGAEGPFLENLRKGDNAWKASVAYFPEKYGEYVIPLAEKILKGESVPKENHPEHVVIDKTNVDKYYPNK